MPKSFFPITNFKGVSTFNEVSGAEVYKSYDEKNFDNKKLLEFRYDLIKEEFKELREAMDTNDKSEIVDALVDILYVTYGYLDALNLDGDKCFDYVQEANMSKFCKTESEAQESVQKYLDDVNSPYDSPEYRYNEKNGLWIVYNKSTGKILKSHKFQPPNFNNLERFSKWNGSIN